ncbi:MAG: 1-acyl-sn-glycerol-3-phosphate acyltransferase [Candidatus Saccharibacteria bacterium]|nr:1-acyl-sn-glycerol-3-phosphate acyltransferase [Candidatus Saccharibacteria bacterium]
MIIGDSKKEVIENIKQNILDGEFNKKVEVGDPQISFEESERAIKHFYKIRENKAKFKIESLPALKSVKDTAKKLADALHYDGLENLPDLKSGAIITSNHFNPLDSLALREAIKEKYGRDVCIVVQDSNLCQPGALGFLFNHIDVLPLSKSAHYIKNEFEPRLGRMIDDGVLVLIYPEEEMWFNYRKPRPVRRGAYQFAAVANAPVISFFTEIREKEGLPVDNDEFYQVDYIAHALGVVYPDSEASVRENAKNMAEADYQMKVKAYEKHYGQKLDYKFDITDIAGWRMV